MDLLYFEDFPPGEVIRYCDMEVSTSRIVAFAEQFDPQPFHLDETVARETMVGGLIASGWHTAGMLMRMNCDHFLNRSASQGSPGIAEVNWLKPVRPGDRLSVRRTTIGARPSASKPELGIVDFSFEVLNQLGEVTMTQRNVMLIRRRPSGQGAEA
jgi:acyl dehydratase